MLTALLDETWGLMVIAIVVVTVVLWIRSTVTSRARMRAIDNSEATFRQLFDDDPATVTYTATPTGLPADMVIEEAHHLGYHLIGSDQQGRTRRLTFGKAVETL